MSRVERTGTRGHSARQRSNSGRGKQSPRADFSVGQDFTLITLLGLASFIALAEFTPTLMRPSGPAIHGWLHSWLGAGATLVPFAFALLPGVVLVNRLRRGFQRGLMAVAGSAVYASLIGGLFPGRDWGGILGTSCATAGSQYLGTYYVVLLALVGLAATVRIAGRALLIPAARLLGIGAMRAGQQVQLASASLAPAIATAGVAIRNTTNSLAERRRTVLEAEIEAADSPDGDSPIVYESLEPGEEESDCLDDDGNSDGDGDYDDETDDEVEEVPESEEWTALADHDPPAVIRKGRLRAVTLEVPADAQADADDAAFATAIALGAQSAKGGIKGALLNPGVDTPDAARQQVNAQLGEYEHVLNADQSELGEGQLGLFGSTQEGYLLPPLALLRDAPKRSGEEQHLEKRAGIIERTLKSFNVDAMCVNAVVGPRVTRYELKIGPGINVSKIHNLADNLALELAVKAVRIEAPIPGLSAVGVEVPNASPDLVTLRNILESGANQRSNHPLTVGLGRDIGGQAIVANLAKMPHLLVAGATGSGKSVCLNALIVSLLMRNAPDTLRLILIDPKRVEMTSYSEVPHLACPVVHDVHQAQSALKWAVAEMERRYRLLESRRARNIAAFNAQAGPGDALPFIVIVVDELADLMMLAGQAVEKLICRIAQLSRAVGIHLVIATQRPDVKVITGTIKANIPSRIAFAVVSQIDSRTILDGGGAEKLLGSGDMLFSPIGENAPLRVQGCYLSDEEIEQVVEHCRNQGRAHYDDAVLTFGAEEGDGGDGSGSGTALRGGESRRNQQDEYFDEALELVRQTGRASTSYLQRRLKIGYNRAARVMEELEQAGFVSAPDSRGDRKVL